MSVAKTILEQIRTIDPRAMFAWGAVKAPVLLLDTAVKFKTSGMVKWKGHVHIKLNGNDLYDIEFYRIRNGQIKTDKVVTDIYAEQLVETIDEQVG